MQGIDIILQTQNEIFDIKHTKLEINQISGDNVLFNELKLEDHLDHQMKKPKEELKMASAQDSPVLSTAQLSPNVDQNNENLECDNQVQLNVEEPEKVINETFRKKYSIVSNKDSYIQMPSDCKKYIIINFTIDTTDDIYLKQAIDHLNASESWEKMTTDQGVDIYRNNVKHFHINNTS